MEILQLRYFYESAKAQNLSATARKFMVPVSSVSVSIKRLEKDLGVSLFERTGNRIILTEKGKLFYQTTEQLLRGLEKGVRAITTTHTDEVKLSLLVCSNRKSVVHRILRFRQLYPSISFKIDLAPQGALTDYDIIVGPSNKDLNEYENFEFSRYSVRIEALSSDPLVGHKITLEQLRDRYFVTLNREKQNGGFQTLKNACIAHGFVPKIMLECNDYECRDLCVLSGAALGINLVGRHASTLSNVEFLDVTDFNEQVVNYFHYKRSAYTGALKLFIDFVKNY